MGHGHSPKNNEFIGNYRTHKSQIISKGANGLQLNDNYVKSPSAAGLSGFGTTASYCTLNIKWDVLQAFGYPNNFIITARPANSSNVGKSQRQLFVASISSSGSQDATWIDSTGTIFEMYYQSDYDQTYGWEAPLATIVVVAQ